MLAPHAAWYPIATFSGRALVPKEQAPTPILFISGLLDSFINISILDTLKSLSQLALGFV